MKDFIPNGLQAEKRPLAQCEELQYQQDVCLQDGNAVSICRQIQSAFSPEQGGRIFHRNVGIYLNVHMALLPRIPTSILALV